MNSSGTGGPPIDTFSPMLSSVTELARRVGALLLEMQSGDGLKTRAKSDGTPVTRADQAAHDLLVDALPQVASYLVVSEESKPGENADRLNAERVWIVDPLDGTRDYIKGSAEFTVNVALVENGRPILGVMDAPGLGVTYVAERGRGAFRIVAGGRTERIHCTSEAAPDQRIVVSGSDIGLHWDRIPSLAAARVKAVSSCVKLGFVADGSAIAYPRLTGSSEWDIAAGHAVVLEAGGRVIGVDGNDLVYNKIHPLNSAFVATGSQHIAAEFALILDPAQTR